jgi:hypothetical protein
MKTKIYAFAISCASLLYTGHAQAQCSDGGRYIDSLFGVTVTSDITYSTSNSTTLKLDVYQPTGDTASQRPLLIMAHGGSFIGGSKTQDNVCTQLCTTFAQRGYVTASIDYRLGNALDMLDSAKAIDVVMKAISDGKSAVRFFRKDAATTNTYRINPNYIIVGGNSAGAVLYMHHIYIDSVNEAPINLRTIINNNGGIEGNSGNDGYSSAVNALFNLAGGLNVPEFVGPGSKPSFNAQGDQDATVPYNCADAQSGITPVRLCGLGAIEPLYVQYNVIHQSIVYPGAGHVPWQSNPAEMTQIDTNAAKFFYQNILCPQATGISQIKETSEISLFPNPATDVVNVRSSAPMHSVSVVDEMGRVVSQVSDINSANYQVSTSQLSKGVYLVKIDLGKNYAQVIKRVVVE